MEVDNRSKWKIEMGGPYNATENSPRSEFLVCLNSFERKVLRGDLKNILYKA